MERSTTRITDNAHRVRHLICLRRQFRCCDHFGRNTKFTDALQLIVSRYKHFFNPLFQIIVKRYLRILNYRRYQK